MTAIAVRSHVRHLTRKRSDHFAIAMSGLEVGLGLIGLLDGGLQAFQSDYDRRQSPRFNLRPT